MNFSKLLLNQAQQLKLSGRYNQQISKMGAMALGASTVTGIIYYFYVYKRRTHLFENHFASMTPDKVNEITERLAKFGVAPSYLPNPGDIEQLSKVASGEITDQEAEAVAAKVYFQGLEKELARLPPEERDIKKQMVETYFHYNIPDSYRCFENRETLFQFLKDIQAGKHSDAVIDEFNHTIKVYRAMKEQENIPADLLPVPEDKTESVQELAKVFIACESTRRDLGRVDKQELVKNVQAIVESDVGVLKQQMEAVDKMLEEDPEITGMLEGLKDAEDINDRVKTLKERVEAKLK